MAALSFLFITHFSDCLTQKAYPSCYALRRCGILNNLDNSSAIKKSTWFTAMVGLHSVCTTVIKP